MADEFSLTTGPFRAIAVQKQDLRLSLDVSGYDEIDILLGVVQISGGGSATVRIITGMQLESDDGWVVAGTFNSVSTTNSWEKINIKNFLRYIRWEVSVLSGSSPTVTFVLPGMLRAWS